MAAIEQAPAAMIGRRIPRLHDPRMLRGNGHYVDDIDESGMVHAAIVRSPHAHARIARFDASAALDSGDALLVLGPDELEQLAVPLPVAWMIIGQQIGSVAIGTRTARFVGQPLGVVVARSRAVAEDVLELIEIEFEELRPVIGIDAALADDAPLLYPDAGGNLAGSISFGDPPDVLGEALASAPHVIERELSVQRVAYNSMEPRGLIAEWIPTTEQLLVQTSSQVPHLVRQELAALLSVRMDQIRVTAPDVGGGFGGKVTLNVDEAMVCVAAKALGRRVKWIEDRAEALTGSYQGRGQRARARLAFDDDGKFLAFAVEVTGDVGAFPNTAGTGPFQVTGLTIEGPYRFPLAGSVVTCVYTNAVPTGAYRGYGMQESAWIRERMIDEAARELGISPIEVRRRNLLTGEEMPFTTRTNLTYDSGDYLAAFEQAIELTHADRAASTDRLRRGFAITANTEVTGFAPTFLLEMFQVHWSGWEGAKVRVNADGTVTVFSGVTSIGQGIETALAQIAAEHLGVPIEWISVQLGDTDTANFSTISSQASRGLTLAGAAVITAATRLGQRLRQLAATALDVDVDAVEHDGDVFRAGDAEITWNEVAHRGSLGWGRGDSPTIALEEAFEFDPPGIPFSYAIHAAGVAVDLDTGQVTVEDYHAVHDSGVIVNPLIADGQVIGGIAQGLGIALLEESAYDPETGQPLCMTYLDYALPLSGDVPDITVTHLCTPSPLIPGGFKGLGEGGIMPPAATIGNALADAVPEIAAKIVSTPLTAGRVWTLLDGAGLAG